MSFSVSKFPELHATYFAEHTDKWSHDQLNRLLSKQRIPARELWESVKDDIEFDEDGYLLFDDTVVSKPYAKEIQVVRRQWSGSEKRVIQGIGIVTGVYVHPKTHAYWIINYRFMTMTEMVKPNFNIFWICWKMLTSSNSCLLGAC